MDFSALSWRRRKLGHVEVHTTDMLLSLRVEMLELMAMAAAGSFFAADVQVCIRRLAREKGEEQLFLDASPDYYLEISDVWVLWRL